MQFVVSKPDAPRSFVCAAVSDRCAVSTPALSPHASIGRCAVSTPALSPYASIGARRRRMCWLVPCVLLGRAMAESSKDAPILVADDDPETVSILREALTFQGYKVVTARDGKEALERVESDHPRLVLL